MRAEKNPAVKFFLLVLGVCIIFLILFYAKIHFIGLLGREVVDIAKTTPSPVHTPPSF